jgi:S-adenosylmethionine synthetase
MTVLLCGASGILGRSVSKLINCVQTFNSNPIPKGIKVDFSNKKCIYDVCVEHGIKTCVNCIVERQVDTCENDWNTTKRVNVDIVDNISSVCNELGIHFIHISTDYVFDGKNAPYYVDSAPNPLQNYGISKLISEYRVVANCKDYTIIRVPVLYSDTLHDFNESSVTMSCKKALNLTKISEEDNYSVRRPVFIPDLAEFIVRCHSEHITGIQHFSNQQDCTTKYKMVEFVSNYLRKPHMVSPIDNPPDDGVERPVDTFLVSKYQASTNIEVGLRRCFGKLWHPKLDKNCMVLMDLDGTLIDTDRIHLECYGIDSLCELSKYTSQEMTEVRKAKVEKIKSVEHIEFMKNAEKFIDYLNDNDINHCVVTNTCDETVKHFKSILPGLNKVKNWVTRGDYSIPKPSSECYELALKRYGKSEKYIIGVENTPEGMKALKGVTSCIYMFNLDPDDDVYVIDDFQHIML